MAQNLGYTGIAGTSNTKQGIGSAPEPGSSVQSTPFVFTKTPNAVIIGNLSNDIGFFFGSSASFATKAAAEGNVHLGGNPTGSLTGSQHYSNFGTPAAGTVFNIHPTAVSSSAADAGDITFIYSSGLRTGPY